MRIIYLRIALKVNETYLLKLATIVTSVYDRSVINKYGDFSFN